MVRKPINWIDLPLRERKAADTRVSLFEAARDAMEDTAFAEIPVRLLCDEVRVTEPTFYKYFPEKSDILVYGIMLWGTDMGWQLAQRREQLNPMERIDWLFATSGNQFSQRPGFTSELMARQLKRRGPKKFIELSIAERIRAFPDQPGIERHPGQGFHALVGNQLRQAKTQDLLPTDAPVRLVREALWSVFIGVLSEQLWQDPRRIPRCYREQLAVLWHGLEAHASLKESI